MGFRRVNDLGFVMRLARTLGAGYEARLPVCRAVSGDVSHSETVVVFDGRYGIMYSLDQLRSRLPTRRF